MKNAAWGTQGNQGKPFDHVTVIPIACIYLSITNRLGIKSFPPPLEVMPSQVKVLAVLCVINCAHNLCSQQSIIQLRSPITAPNEEIRGHHCIC